MPSVFRDKMDHPVMGMGTRHGTRSHFTWAETRPIQSNVSSRRHLSRYALPRGGGGRGQLLGEDIIETAYQTLLLQNHIW